MANLLNDIKEFEQRLATYVDRVVDGDMVSIFDIKRILAAVREIIANEEKRQAND
jgi:hypothetical protein